MPQKKPATKKAATSNEPVAQPETREQKLVRLANKRVAAAITKLRLIGNLSAYRPTDEQVDKIMEAIGSSAAAVESRLRIKRQSEDSFTL